MALSIDISGLDELLEELNPSSSSRGRQKTKATMNTSLTELDKAVRLSVFNKFAYETNLKLSKKSTKTSASTLEGSLQYELEYLDLSKFPTTWKMGNINSSAKGLGRVHTTTVVRGKPHTIVGRSHHGGFILLDKSGQPKRYGRHGTQMVERIGDKKLPLRLLLGPSTFTMINWAFRKDEKVQAVIAKYSASILEGYL